MVYFLNKSIDFLSARRGFASLTIQPNNAPQNGTCLQTTPSEGWAMETQFTVQCFDWIDPDNNNNGGTVAAADNFFTYLLVLSNGQIVFTRSYGGTFDLFLPPGNPDKDWDLDYEVQVMDVLGGVTTAFKS